MLQKNSYRKYNGDSYVAIVHSDVVELVTLDRKGSVLQQDVLPLGDLIVDKPHEIQVGVFFFSLVIITLLMEQTSVEDNKPPLF